MSTSPSIPQLSANYTDLQGLEGIRRRADENPEETLRFAAQQFEALFLQMMLKSARDAKVDEGLFDSEQTDFYQDLHDKQMAINLAQGKGIGIAELLVQQLRRDQGMEVDAPGTGGREARAASPQAIAVERVNALHQAQRDDVARSPAPSAAFELPAVASSSPVDEVKATPPVELGSPEAFVKALWPQAQQAARSLGVNPSVLLAQAALETGWGRSVSQRSDGSSSFNLFNIKADARWDGDRVSVSTLEFREGSARREQAQFRAYDSYAESFSDYVDFLKSSARYRPALDSAADSQRFVTELARAGYATDPNYAEKIIGIVEGEPMARSLSGVEF